MVGIFASTKFCRLCLCSTLIAFWFSCVIPTPAHAQIINGINEMALIIRLEKLVEKLLKLSKKNDIDSMIDIALDVKAEVEAATGSSISIEHKLEQIKNDLQQRGYTPPKKQWGNLKKKFKKKEKKNEHRAEYTAMILADPYGVIDLDDEQLLYSTKHEHDDKKEDDQDDKKVELPGTVICGVTVALVGFFIFCLPLPASKEWGKKLMETGIVMAVQGGYAANEKKEDEKEKDKKRDK